jgi:hypothetical protein
MPKAKHEAAEQLDGARAVEQLDGPAPVDVGTRVRYRLSQWDVDQIHARPTDERNHHTAGEVFGAVIVRLFSQDTANIVVTIDGRAPLWATSRLRDEQSRNGTWVPE